MSKNTTVQDCAMSKTVSLGEEHYQLALEATVTVDAFAELLRAQVDTICNGSTTAKIVLQGLLGRIVDANFVAMQILDHRMAGPVDEAMIKEVRRG